MKLFKYLALAVLVIASMALAGCGGDKYVGTWYARQGKAIYRDVIEKDKNDAKAYTEASHAFFYAEEMIPAGRNEKGRQVLNFRYTWTEMPGITVRMTEKDGRLYGKADVGNFKDEVQIIEYNDKNGTLVCRTSLVPIDIESKKEKDFDMNKEREELKKMLTTEFNDVKKELDKRHRSPIAYGNLEFVDEKKESKPAGK